MCIICTEHSQLGYPLFAGLVLAMLDNGNYHRLGIFFSNERLGIHENYIDELNQEITIV